MIKGLLFWCPLTPATVGHRHSSVPPAEPERLSDEAKDVGVLQDHLGGGLACAVAAARVHSDHQRLPLHGAAAYAPLQRRAVLQRVERHHAVIVIGCQQQNGRVGGARVGLRRQIVEGRIPEWRWEETSEHHPVGKFPSTCMFCARVCRFQYLMSHLNCSGLSEQP